MVKIENFSIVSESIVEELLKKHNPRKKIEKISGSGPGKIGDFRVGKKIIEVKAIYSDESGKPDDKFDFVSSGFTISDKEWDFIQNNAKNFELWVVYRLDRKNYGDYPVKYAVMKGTTLLKCKPSWHKVTLSIPKEKWQQTFQRKVPIKVWNKNKNKKR